MVRTRVLTTMVWPYQWYTYTNGRRVFVAPECLYFKLMLCIPWYGIPSLYGTRVPWYTYHGTYT
jgi:hypothetical protein